MPRGTYHAPRDAQTNRRIGHTAADPPVFSSLLDVTVADALDLTDPATQHRYDVTTAALRADEAAARASGVR